MAAMTLAACASAPTAPAATAPSPTLTREAPTMHKRILIAMTSHDRKGDTGQPTGAYLPEIAHPYDVFTKAGYDVELASVRGGRVPLDGTDDPDAVSAAFLRDVSARLHASLASSAIDPSRYDAIVFAGGHGAMWDLPNDAAFAKAAAAIYERGGVVAAVCHGPAALVNIQLSNGQYLLAGKDVAGFTNEEERAVKLDKVVPFLLEDAMVARGAKFHGAAMWQPQVVASERLVTGQNPASATGVAERVVDVLAQSAK